MDMTGFCGVIYRTEYAMICQPMTRIDTSIAVCFFLLLFAVKIRQWLMEMKQIIAVGRVENDARECQMNAHTATSSKRLDRDLYRLYLSGTKG